MAPRMNSNRTKAARLSRSRLRILRSDTDAATNGRGPMNANDFGIAGSLAVAVALVVVVDLREPTAIDDPAMAPFLRFHPDCRAGGAEVGPLICGDARRQRQRAGERLARRAGDLHRDELAR